MFRHSLEEVAVDMVVGDLAFFYTDGLTEARDRSGRMYGLDRVLEVLEAHPTAKLATLLESVRRSLEDFRGGREAEDDVTMIALRRARG